MFRVVLFQRYRIAQTAYERTTADFTQQYVNARLLKHSGCHGDRCV